MLQKDPAKRISAIDAMSHRWFEKSHADKPVTDKKIFQRLREFRAPQRLQMEALTFLVNNITKEIDFKSLREAFRVLDKNNTGLLKLQEIKEAFKESNIPQDDLDEMFRNLDFDQDGSINYSEFLAATVDRRKALSM